MGKKCLENLVPSLVLFLIVTFFRFKFPFGFPSTSLGINAQGEPFWLLFFGLGGIIGTFIWYLEGIVYCLLLEPEEQISKDVSVLLANKNVKEALRAIEVRKYEIKSRVFHTFLFQVIFAILTLYVLTSTMSAMASGVCLFAYLQLLKDQISDLSFGEMGGWGGFFGLAVPQSLQRFWVGGGILILLYFVYILVR